MKVAVIRGSTGLVGSQAVEFFSKKGFLIVGIDNDLRRYFFGKEASTEWIRRQLKESFTHYSHYHLDIRNKNGLEKIFKKFKGDIKLVIHAAGQPSHDWAAKNALVDFAVNANGTLNVLELTRLYCPGAVFIFTSTNKVYGDSPNRLPVRELKNRYDLSRDNRYYHGIDETFPVDHSTHSLFGSSKLAADILVQEYGRYFGMKTASFRCGCITGPNHSGAVLHGFLSYLMKCCVTGERYAVFGYKGKQVRDNLHSYDLVNAFYHFYQRPRPGEVYNMGGGRENSCSVLEAIRLCEKLIGKKLKYFYLKENRKADHIWYISSLKKFRTHFPRWKQEFGLKE